MIQPTAGRASSATVALRGERAGRNLAVALLLCVSGIFIAALAWLVAGFFLAWAASSGASPGGRLVVPGVCLVLGLMCGGLLAYWGVAKLRLRSRALTYIVILLLMTIGPAVLIGFAYIVGFLGEGSAAT